MICNLCRKPRKENYWTWVAIIDSGLKWEQEWLLKNSPVLLQPSNMEKALKWSYSSEKLNADVDVMVTIISFYF